MLSHVILVVHVFVYLLQDIVWAPDADVTVSHQHNMPWLESGPALINLDFLCCSAEGA